MYEIIGKIMASKYKLKVMLELSKGMKTPSQLVKNTGLSASSISRTLKELLKMSVVICITPSLRKGKIYKLTNFGYEILDKINNILS